MVNELYFSMAYEFYNIQEIIENNSILATSCLENTMFSK